MSFLSRLLRPSQSLPAVSQPHPHSPSVNPANSPTSVRRELLRVVLRDTLGKHGIPASWIGCEMLVLSGRGRDAGMHLRFLLRHWDPRLLLHAMALQKSLQLRLEQFDPLAMQWFRGMSWQLDLPDASVCPSMPSNTSWTTAASPASVNALFSTPMQGERVASSAAEHAAPHGGAPDVADKLAELNKLFEAGDKTRKRYGDGPGGVEPLNFEATQPLFAATEPARL